jgi:hypothetical protein
MTPDWLGHRSELVDLRISAGNIDETGRHAPGSLPHAAVDEILELREFLRRRVDLAAAEDQRPRRAVRNEMGDVRPGALGVDLGEILFDIDGAAAAVTGHERRATLADVIFGSAGLLGDDRLVAVIVEIDEPRRDDQPRAVDRLANFAGGKLADGDNLVSRDGHVAGPGRRTCAVENLSPVEENVGVDGPGRLSGRTASDRKNHENPDREAPLPRRSNRRLSQCIHPPTHRFGVSSPKKSSLAPAVDIPRLARSSAAIDNRGLEEFQR